MNNDNLAPQRPVPSSARVSPSCWNLNTDYATKGRVYLWHCRCTGRYSPWISDQARQRAERSFKKEQRAQDGRAAVTEYEAEARATREKTARLKALRLAREAEIVIAL